MVYDQQQVCVPVAGSGDDVLNADVVVPASPDTSDTFPVGKRRF